jgi:hypothetical protein
MIRKFNDFKVNELNTSTYLSAANKFKKLGHEKRASELSFWAHNKDSYKFGTFSIKADVWNGKFVNFIAPISDREIYNKEKNKYKIKQEGPIDVYINFDSNKDFYYDDPEFDAICISVYGTSKEHGVTDALFTIVLKVKHEDDGGFVLTGETFIDPTISSQHEGKILFDDRGSVNRFKRNFLNENFPKYVDGLREIFLELSTHEEYQKMVKLLSEISVNQLYN